MELDREGLRAQDRDKDLKRDAEVPKPKDGDSSGPGDLSSNGTEDAVPDPEEKEEPPQKKRKVNSGLSLPLSRDLRPRKGKEVTAPLAPLATAPHKSKTRAPAKLRSRSSPTKWSSPVEKPLAKGMESEGVPWAAVSKDFEVPEPRECETLNEETRLDPTVLYDLAQETLEIPYWKFDSGMRNGVLRATKHIYSLGAFHATVVLFPWLFLFLIKSSLLQRGDLQVIRKIMESAPTTQSSTYSEEREVPLHIHPYSQRFHTSGDTRDADGSPLEPDVVPGPAHSIIFVQHESQWRDLTGRQKQELLRTRCALIISDRPYEQDGQTIDFDAEGLSAFTHLDRLAFVQGTPSSALVASTNNLHRFGCEEIRRTNEAGGRPPQ